MGYCRPQGLPDESVPASAFTNHRGNHRGGSRDIRPFDRVQPYGCAGYVGDLYS